LKRPFGVAIICFFYIIGAVVLIYTSIFYHPNADQFGIAARFGVPTLPEQPVRLIVAVIAFILAFGYFSLKKWGFWSMVCYSVVFGTISLRLAFMYHQQPFVGNVIWSAIVLIYTLIKRRSFQVGNTAMSG
jgi:hypothetical protein